MRLSFLAGLVLVAGIVRVEAAGGVDLAALTSQAAARVQAAIPDSKVEVKGTGAIVRKNAVLMPDMEFKGSKLISMTGGKSTWHAGYKGVVFFIELSEMPYSGPGLPKAPTFDSKKAQHGVGYFRTGALQEFPAKHVAMAVQILFGPYTEMASVQRAYAELTKFAASQLGR